jgi:hypothetical protein
MRVHTGARITAPIARKATYSNVTASDGMMSARTVSVIEEPSPKSARSPHSRFRFVGHCAGLWCVWGHDGEVRASAASSTPRVFWCGGLGLRCRLLQQRVPASAAAATDTRSPIVPPLYRQRHRCPSLSPSTQPLTAQCTPRSSHFPNICRPSCPVL